MDLDHGGGAPPAEEQCSRCGAVGDLVQLYDAYDVGAAPDARGPRPRPREEPGPRCRACFRADFVAGIERRVALIERLLTDSRERRDAERAAAMAAPHFRAQLAQVGAEPTPAVAAFLARYEGPGTAPGAGV